MRGGLSSLSAVQIQPGKAFAIVRLRDVRWQACGSERPSRDSVLVMNDRSQSRRAFQRPGRGRQALLLLTSGTSFQGGPPDTNSFVGRRITSVQRNPTAGAAFASQ